MLQKKLVIPVECYSRVSGYFRPLNQWNKGKQSEFEDRKKISLIEIERVIYEEI